MFSAGVAGMECSLPLDGRHVSLTQLSKDSFRECQTTLTLTDLLIIIFSGISVSVVAIMTSFFLASTVHCFQRWSKGTKGDEEESEEWQKDSVIYLFIEGILTHNDGTCHATSGDEHCPGTVVVIVRRFMEYGKLGHF